MALATWSQFLISSHTGPRHFLGIATWTIHTQTVPRMRGITSLHIMTFPSWRKRSCWFQDHKHRITFAHHALLQFLVGAECQLHPIWITVFPRNAVYDTQRR